MLIAIIAIIVAIICPSVPASLHIEPCIIVNESEAIEWAAFHVDAYEEYADEFTALFNSYETKRASNGRMMIRSGNAGSFKFARKA